MNGVIRRIKSRGYDVLIKEDYDTARDYVSDLFKDCDGGFKDAGFTVPERIKDGEIATADGYQIIEGYYGGNYSYKNIKKGDELRATNSRQYELITYGEYDDDYFAVVDAIADASIPGEVRRILEDNSLVG